MATVQFPSDFISSTESHLNETVSSIQQAISYLEPAALSTTLEPIFLTTFKANLEPLENAISSVLAWVSDEPQVRERRREDGGELLFETLERGHRLSVDLLEVAKPQEGVNVCASRLSEVVEGAMEDKMCKEISEAIWLLKGWTGRLFGTLGICFEDPEGGLEYIKGQYLGAVSACFHPLSYGSVGRPPRWAITGVIPRKGDPLDWRVLQALHEGDVGEKGLDEATRNYTNSQALQTNELQPGTSIPLPGEAQSKPDSVSRTEIPTQPKANHDQTVSNDVAPKHPAHIAPYTDLPSMKNSQKHRTPVAPRKGFSYYVTPNPGNLPSGSDIPQPRPPQRNDDTWQSWLESPQPPLMRGLRNPDRRCFAIAALQAILHSPPFMNFVMTEVKRSHICSYLSPDDSCTLCPFIEFAQSAFTDISRVESVLQKLVDYKRPISDGDAIEWLWHIFRNWEKDTGSDWDRLFRVNQKQAFVCPIPGCGWIGFGELEHHNMALRAAQEHPPNSGKSDIRWILEAQRLVPCSPCPNCGLTERVEGLRIGRPETGQPKVLILSIQGNEARRENISVYIWRWFRSFPRFPYTIFSLRSIVLHSRFHYRALVRMPYPNETLEEQVSSNPSSGRIPRWFLFDDARCTEVHTPFFDPEYPPETKMTMNDIGTKANVLVYEPFLGTQADLDRYGAIEC